MKILYTSVASTKTVSAGVNMPHCDHEGFLLDHRQWTQEFAQQTAHAEQIELHEEHWEVILLLRNFYLEYEQSPAMRILVKQIKLQYGADKGNSIHLMTLFPPSPAKIASKIAGIPKPLNCL